MNHKTELMTHIRKQINKFEPEMVCKRYTPTTLHYTTLYTAPYLSHMNIYANIKVSETERKKWMFWTDNNRLNLHFVGQRRQRRRRRQRRYAVPFSLNFNAIIFAFEQYEWPSSTTTTTTTIVTATKRMQRDILSNVCHFNWLSLYHRYHNWIIILLWPNY